MAGKLWDDMSDEEKTPFREKAQESLTELYGSDWKHPLLCSTPDNVFWPAWEDDNSVEELAKVLYACVSTGELPK